MKQLGQILHPIVIINTKQFFNPLLQMMESLVKQEFMREIHMDIWTVVSEPEEVLDAIRNAPAWDKSKIKYAPA
jgi:predicted Rossmann-fold nucleotide-binding protein